MLNPSRPGDFSGCILNQALLTYSISALQINISFWATETFSLIQFRTEAISPCLDLKRPVKYWKIRLFSSVSLLTHCPSSFLSLEIKNFCFLLLRVLWKNAEFICIPSPKPENLCLLLPVVVLLDNQVDIISPDLYKQQQTFGIRSSSHCFHPS